MLLPKLLNSSLWTFQWLYLHPFKTINHSKCISSTYHDAKTSRTHASIMLAEALSHDERERNRDRTSLYGTPYRPALEMTQLTNSQRRKCQIWMLYNAILSNMFASVGSGPTMIGLCICIFCAIQHRRALLSIQKTVAIQAVCQE